MSDLSTVADALTTAMTDYHLSASAATATTRTTLMPDEEVTLPLVAVEALLAASFSACREQSRRRRRRAPWYVPLVASRAAVRLALPKTSTYFGVLAGLTDSTDLLSAAEGSEGAGDAR